VRYVARHRDQVSKLVAVRPKGTGPTEGDNNKSLGISKNKKGVRKGLRSKNDQVDLH
jgi:hypothetical protein